MKQDGASEERPARVWKLGRALLLLPFGAALWVGSYNSAEPAWAGIPFYYWYQLLWVVLSAVLIAIVYRAEH